MMKILLTFPENERWLWNLRSPWGLYYKTFFKYGPTPASFWFIHCWAFYNVDNSKQFTIIGHFHTMHVFASRINSAKGGSPGLACTVPLNYFQDWSDYHGSYNLLIWCPIDAWWASSKLVWLAMLNVLTGQFTEQKRKEQRTVFSNRNFSQLM